MIRWLKPLFLLLGLILVGVASAHENTPPEIPPVTQRCVSIENNPPDDWTFEGTIVTFRQREGVYGFRADTPSRYYIAFDSDKQFAGSGTFSPDGQWFISFWGQRRYATITDSHFRVTQLVITSTQPKQETYLIPFKSVNAFSFYAEFAPPIWFDNTHFGISGVHDNTEGLFVIQPFEGVIRPASEEEMKQLQSPLPPWTTILDRIFPASDSRIPHNAPHVFVLGFPHSIGGNLLITDAETYQIYDTCLDLKQGYMISPSGKQVAISPESSDGFVYVFDLNDWTAYRLNLAANPVVGWFADP